jgi:hypothetical protein
MTARSRGHWVRWCVALVVLASGCRKSAPPSSPGAATMASGTADELAAVQAELAGNAQELQALGVVVGVSKKSAEVGKLDDGGTSNTDPSVAAPGAEHDGEDVPNTPSPNNPPPPAPPKPTTMASVDACGRICALAGAACDLSQRICTLAEQHDGDARYEDLCWNAERQCEAASDACADCSTC